MKGLFLKLTLLTLIIGTSYSFADSTPKGWSANAPAETPYGNVEEQLEGLRKAADNSEKLEHLTKLKLSGIWYARQRTGYLWLEKIVDTLLLEAGIQNSPKTQTEAFYILGKLVEKTCGLKEIHLKIFNRLKKLVLEDPNPSVRKAALGIGPLDSLTECHKKEQMADDIIQTLFTVIAQDPDMDVLDSAASLLRFSKDKGIRLPEQTKTLLTDAARERLMVMMPNQAWACFVRGPINFHLFEALHNDLIRGPLPNNAVMAAHAMIPIDYSLKYAKDLAAGSPVRIKILLIKYLLTSKVLFGESLKREQAEQAYLKEAVQQDEESSFQQMLKEAKNIRTNEFLHQGAAVGGGNIHVKQAKQKILKRGGPTAIIKKIGEFTTAPTHPAPLRRAAWTAIKTIQANEISRLRKVFPLDIIRMLSLNMEQETDPEVLSQAKSVIEVLKKVGPQ